MKRFLRNICQNLQRDCHNFLLCCNSGIHAHMHPPCVTLCLKKRLRMMCCFTSIFKLFSYGQSYLSMISLLLSAQSCRFHSYLSQTMPQEKSICFVLRSIIIICLANKSKGVSIDSSSRLLFLHKFYDSRKKGKCTFLTWHDNVSIFIA